ncbi:hypothetical protein ACWDSD_41260 [Streptomyces spiralis]
MSRGETDRYRLEPRRLSGPHHLTASLRRAAMVADDTRLVHLWAGTGHRQAKEEPAALTIQRLAGLR